MKENDIKIDKLLKEYNDIIKMELTIKIEKERVEKEIKNLLKK